MLYLLPLDVCFVIGWVAKEYMSMCGPILVVHLLNVWAVCHRVQRSVDRHEDKQAKSELKIGVRIDLCQAFNGCSLIVLLPQVSGDYRVVVKRLSNLRADLG